MNINEILELAVSLAFIVAALYFTFELYMLMTVDTRGRRRDRREAKRNGGVIVRDFTVPARRR